MMTKKDFKQLATALSSIEDDNKRNEVVELMCECCLKNNSRFDDNRFYLLFKLWSYNRMDQTS